MRKVLVISLMSCPLFLLGFSLRAASEPVVYQASSGAVCTIVGTSGDDTLTGTSKNDVICGLGGADTIYGNSGNDVIDGGPGDDVISGGLGNDQVDPGVGHDTLNGDAGVNALYFAASYEDIKIYLRDGFVAATNIDTKFLNFRNVTSGYGDDLVVGDTSSNTISTGSGNDTVSADAGNDVIDTGEGNDTFDASGATVDLQINLGAKVSVGLGSDRLVQVENVIGGSGNDSITGSSADNNLAAGPGNDVVYLGTGADVAQGGAGVNTFSASKATEPVVIDLAHGLASGTLANATLSGFVNATGGLGNDTLTGNSENNSLNGGAGNDTLLPCEGADTVIGGTGVNTVSYSDVNTPLEIDLAAKTAIGEGINAKFTGIQNATGSQANDRILGDAQRNTLDGGLGDDTLIGGVGADTMIGGLGQDVADYSSLTKTITVDLAAGKVSGADSDLVSEIENVIGGSGNDLLSGDDAANVLDGGPGSDLYSGGNGDDTLVAGSGDDTYAGGLGTDTYFAESATSNLTVDMVSGLVTGFGSDKISEIENVTTGDGDDVVTGDAESNTVSTGSGDDRVSAGAGDDRINSGQGDDFISGGAGHDTLDGSSGQNTLIFTGTDLPLNIDLNAGTSIGLGNDKFSNFQNVRSGAGDDQIFGDYLNNEISGGAGNDTISGGQGDDALDGNSGADTLSYANTSSNIDVDLSASQANGQGSDTVKGFENVVTGSGADSVTGTTTNNVITTGLGNDVIFGSTGDDALDAGSGIDKIDFSTFTGDLEVNLTLQTVTGPGNQELIGFEDAESGSGDDVLIGNSETNRLAGGGGSDTLFGSGGKLIYLFSQRLGAPESNRKGNTEST